MGENRILEGALAMFEVRLPIFVSTALLALGVLGGCVTTGSVTPLQPAAVVAPIRLPSGPIGSASFAIAQALQRGMGGALVYRVEGQPWPDGSVTWQVFLHSLAGARSQFVTVRAGSVSEVQDVAVAALWYRPEYGNGLGDIGVDSTDLLDTVSKAWAGKEPSGLGIYTPSELKDRFGKATENTAWQVWREDASMTLDVLTSRLYP
jgi:hypothetical protein